MFKKCSQSLSWLVTEVVGAVRSSAPYVCISHDNGQTNPALLALRGAQQVALSGGQWQYAAQAGPTFCLRKCRHRKQTILQCFRLVAATQLNKDASVCFGQ